MNSCSVGQVAKEIPQTKTAKYETWAEAVEREGEAAVKEVYEASQRWANVPWINRLFILNAIGHKLFALSGGALSVAGWREYIQEALLIYIRSKKDSDDLSVSAQDITSALQELKEQVSDDDRRAEIVSQCQQVAPDLLLIDGFKRYNENPLNRDRNIRFEYSTSINNQIHQVVDRSVMSSLYELTWSTKDRPGLLLTLDKDIHFYLYSKLSLKDAASLGQTSKGNWAIYKDPRFWQDRLKEEWKADLAQGDSPEQIFREWREFRKDEDLAADEEGTNDLIEQIGVENYDAITVRKICNRELTIADFREPVESRPEERLPIDQKGRNYLKDVLGLDCGPKTLEKIMRKKISVQHAKQLDEDFAHEVEQANSDESHPLFLYREVLAVKVYRKYFLDGSLELMQLNKGVNLALTSPVHQEHIDSGRLDIQLVCNLPNKVESPLDKLHVQHYVVFFGLPPEMAVTLTDQQCANLQRADFQLLFTKGLLTFAKYVGLTHKQSKRLQQFYADILYGDLSLDEVIDTKNSWDNLSYITHQCRMQREKERGGEKKSREHCIIS